MCGCIESKEPFTKVVALDYYDGPTEGVAWCDACQSAWKFELLGWDNAREIRVFGLAPLPTDAFAELVQACRSTGDPHWPVWIPLWQFRSDEERAAAERRVDEIIARAEPPEFAAASRDLVSEILAVKRLSPNDLAKTQNWLSFVGLAA